MLFFISSYKYHDFFEVSVCVCVCMCDPVLQLGWLRLLGRLCPQVGGKWLTDICNSMRFKNNWVYCSFYWMYSQLMFPFLKSNTNIGIMLYHSLIIVWPHCLCVYTIVRISLSLRTFFPFFTLRKAKLKQNRTSLQEKSLVFLLGRNGEIIEVKQHSAQSLLFSDWSKELL